MPKQLSVIVSQGQSNHPHKRAVEEAIVAGLLSRPGIHVTVVPHLYDLASDSSGVLCLSGISGDMVVCSWLFPRAAHWTLDRHGVRGRVGTTQIPAYGHEDADEDGEHPKSADESDGVPRVGDRRNETSRTIYCLDLRTYDEAEPYLEEIERLARELAVEVVGLNISSNGKPVAARGEKGATVEAEPLVVPTQSTADGATDRRWYPVIDFSRCTNCLECIDFCLFGVYGIDGTETILVEQPDNCRKGCPACSRVCPENAIIFPQHKTGTIAGSPGVEGPGKIDLSLLFGAPNPAGTGAVEAFDTAIRERDEQLLAAGREAVGAHSDDPQQSISQQSISQQSQSSHATGQDLSDGSKDELDALIDQLDALDW